MRFAVKNKKKLVKAYQLGAGTEMEQKLIEEGTIRLTIDNRYELFSQEAKDGKGQLADKGDYFKVNTVDGRHYPYNNTKNWFEENHTHIVGDEYEQKPKQVQIWETGDSESEEIRYLLSSGKLVINEEDEEKYFNAMLWGAPLSAAKDAVVIIYSTMRGEDRKINDIDFGFVSRKDFESSYTVIEQERKKHHVLIMALSTFYRVNQKTGVTSYDATKYCYYDRSLWEGPEEPRSLYEYIGHYQLEPIPKFIVEYKGESITDMILLETKEVKDDKRTDVWMGSTDKGKNEAPSFTRYYDITAAEYFHDWVRKEIGDEVNIIPIEVDMLKPVDVFSKVLEQVKNLYKEIVDDDDWRLWIDTHGGFRGISDVLVSAAKFFATDNHQPIPTNGIYTVFHSQESGKADEIAVQTAYYLAESAELMRRFLNYGQYLYETYVPCGDDKPYAFISYRHQPEHYVNIQNLFAQFKKADLPFWYDEGIHYRDNWKKVLREKNAQATLFVALLSNSYFESKACWKEFIEAVANRKKGMSEKLDGFGDTQDVDGKAQWWDTIHLVLIEKDVKIPSSDDEIPAEVKDAVVGYMKEHQVTWNDIWHALRFNDNAHMFKYFDFTDEMKLAAKTPVNPGIGDWIRNALKTQLQ